MKNLETFHAFIDWKKGVFNFEASDDLNISLNKMFMLPNQMAYIYNCSTGRIVDSCRGQQSFFGYDDFVLRSPDQLYEHIVPQDVEQTIKHTWSVFDWAFKNKEAQPFLNSSQFGYRIKCKNGRYKKVMRQGIMCGKSNGLITHTLSILTDVSNLDNSSHVSVKVMGPGAEYFDPEIPEVGKLQHVLSKRECEILKLLARGKSSREIALQLSISRHTVDTHRRNMIHKLEVRNCMELIYLGRDMGLI